jgi:peptidoglycan/xylan/chitin deacetylase (PgdA/CDA1 family)
VVIGLALVALAAVAGRLSTVHARRSPATASRPLALSPAHVRPDPGLAGPRARRELLRLAALGLPVFCGGARGDAVAFTFDDGPGVYTHYAVRKLTAAHERATFFVVGKSITAWPRWVRREAQIAALGDHTLHHLDLAVLPPALVYDEIAGARAMIERRSGQAVVLFRPPYGARDATVDRVVRRLGLVDVMWSVDSGDSLGANWVQIIRNVARGLRPGAVIEMHENRGQTIRALDTLLGLLRRRHLHSVSVTSLLASDPPSGAQLRRGEAGCGVPARTRRRGAE